MGIGLYLIRERSFGIRKVEIQPQAAFEAHDQIPATSISSLRLKKSSIWPLYVNS
jgi:hypothetical protein